MNSKTNVERRVRYQMSLHLGAPLPLPSGQSQSFRKTRRGRPAPREAPSSFNPTTSPSSTAPISDGPSSRISIWRLTHQPATCRKSPASARGIRLSTGSGIASYEWNQEGVNEAHRQDASRDGRASEQQRCGFQGHDAAKKRRDRGKDAHRVCRYGLPARLAIDRAPRTEARLAHQAHRRATAVGTFDHFRR